MSGAAIEGFDQLPAAVREKLRTAPANLKALDLLYICQNDGEQAALATIDRWIKGMRPAFKSAFVAIDTRPPQKHRRRRA